MPGTRTPEASLPRGTPDGVGCGVALVQGEEDRALDNLYEAMIIVDASQSDEELAATIEQLKTVVARADGQVESAYPLFRRRLAYHIGKHTEGNYVMMYFRGARAVEELTREMHMSTAIVRAMVVVASPRALWLEGPPVPPSRRPREEQPPAEAEPAAQAEGEREAPREAEAAAEGPEPKAAEEPEPEETPAEEAPAEEEAAVEEAGEAESPEEEPDEAAPAEQEASS